jgi:hypothetical protein
VGNAHVEQAEREVGEALLHQFVPAAESWTVALEPLRDPS